MDSGCVFCGSELTDSRKRTKLNGKVSDLPDRISSVLNVSLSSINVDSYICNERCYRDLKRLEKILEDAKSLQQSLKEKFTSNNRSKRCVPSDSRISPSVSAPSKSLRHATDQGRGKAAKSLSFAEIQPKPNPGPEQLLLVWPLQIVPLEETNISDGNCEENFCQVQVSNKKLISSFTLFWLNMQVKPSFRHYTKGIFVHNF